MKIKGMRVFAVGLTYLSMAGTAFSQIAGGPSLSPGTISAFMGNPGQALSNAPSGGDQLSSLVRDLLTSDKSTLPSLAGLLSQATPAQKQSVLTGLADAAKLYVKTDFVFANSIAQAVANTGDAALIKSYASLAGDAGTASTGGGGGGSSSGGPTANNSATGGANNGGGQASNNSTPNTTPSLFSGSSLGGISQAPVSGS